MPTKCKGNILTILHGDNHRQWLVCVGSVGSTLSRGNLALSAEAVGVVRRRSTGALWHKTVHTEKSGGRRIMIRFER